MSTTLLTICLPTYNRSSFLEARLKQLRELITPDLEQAIEVLVSDNCSTDSTQETVNSFKPFFRHFTYQRHPLNYGYDYNYISALLKANSRYIWVFGDDDIFLPNALSTALSVICNDAPSLIIANQQIGDTYTSRSALGEIMYSLDSNESSSLYDTCVRHGFLNILGFVSALIIERPALRDIDYIRHMNYDSALAHSTIIFESHSCHQAMITKDPLLLVEPPQEHQSREHQIKQDPRVNFHTWTLNLSRFFVDMMRRGLLVEPADSFFYNVKHCNTSIAKHILGSFKTSITEAREIPSYSWNKIEDFLKELNDQESLREYHAIRKAHDNIFGDIYRIRTSIELKGQINSRLEQEIYAS